MNEHQLNYAEWFQEYPLQVMITLTYKYEHQNSERSWHEARAFVRGVAKKWRIQIAGFFVVNHVERFHLHLFLFADRLDLCELPEPQVVDFWKYGSAKVSCRYSDGINMYAGCNISPDSADDYDLYWHNKRLLNKARQVSYK